MGKTAELTVVQKTIIDTLHKEGKPQKRIAKEAGCSQRAVSKHVTSQSAVSKCGANAVPNVGLKVVFRMTITGVYCEKSCSGVFDKD